MLFSLSPWLGPLITVQCIIKIFGMHLVVIYFIIIYLLRPKAAQHNITITKTEETHKKLKTKIYKNRKQ